MIKLGGSDLIPTLTNLNNAGKIESQLLTSYQEKKESSKYKYVRVVDYLKSLPPETKVRKTKQASLDSIMNLIYFLYFV